MKIDQLPKQQFLQLPANYDIVLPARRPQMLPVFMTIDDPADRDLLAGLYEEHARFLVGTAYRILGDRAEA